MDMIRMFVGSTFRHTLTVWAGYLLANGLLAKDQQSAFVDIGLSIIAGGIGLGWSWWQKSGHAAVVAKLAGWGVKAVKAVIFGLAVLALAEGWYAQASDLPLPVKAVPRAFAPSTCTIANCSGFYVGGELVGVGSNLDIIGSGINGSVFAGGGMVGLDAGYQLWNGVWFAAIEAGVDLDVSATTHMGTNFDKRFFGYQVVKLGRGLQDLLNFQATGPTPSQGPSPINIPASLASSLISPYLQFGAAERHGATGWVSGAGAEFVVANGWNLDLSYMRVQYQNAVVDGVVGLKDENLVKLALKRKF